MPKPSHITPLPARLKNLELTTPVKPPSSLPLKLLGLVDKPGEPLAVALALPSTNPSKAVMVPLLLCAPSRQSALDEFFMRPGFFSALKGTSTKTLAAELRNFAETTTVHALDTEGIQTFEHDGSLCKVWVRSGNVHWLTPQPDGAEVVLVGKAAREERWQTSDKQFRQYFGDLLQHCPRLLVVLLFTLAAPLLSEFGIASLALALIGMTTSGKTLIQRATSLWVNGEHRVENFNGTPQGIIEFIREQGRNVVNFEDAHGAKAGEALIAALMATGNGATERKRSRYGRAAMADAPILGTLVVSAEAGLADTFRAAGQPLLSGQFARAIELHMGKYGMFDALCGHETSAQLAACVKNKSHLYEGVVGDAFVQALAPNWEAIKRMWLKRRDEVRSGILRAAGITEPSDVTNRQLETLTFIGFTGAIAAKYDALPVKRRHIYEALGLLLREQESRLQGSRTPAGQKVVEAVRHFIQTHPARFLPIERASDPTPVNGLAGYKKPINHRPAFLFFPGTFDAEFISKFGREAFVHLRDAGHLVCQGKRGNRCQVHVRFPGQEGRGTPMDFVAISESILAAEG